MRMIVVVREWDRRSREALNGILSLRSLLDHISGLATIRRAGLPFAIVHAIQVVLLCAIVGVIAWAFVGFLEALVLLPLKIVFHIPTGAADFLITTDNPYIAISVSVAPETVRIKSGLLMNRDIQLVRFAATSL